MSTLWISGAVLSAVPGLTALPVAAPGELEHPAVPFLDAGGMSVVDSGLPLSTMRTCGTCHDTDYIASHSYHVSLGTDAERAARFDALTYDTGDPAGKPPAALGEWIRRFGARHVGGGFAAGTEMNCFLCHLAKPANDERLLALQSGDFEWAPTATLSGTGLVEAQGGNWSWKREAFDGNGAPAPSQLGLTAPGSSNCGLCHGAVVTEYDDPFFMGPDPAHNRTETTGVIFSPGRIRRSGMNIAGKDGLSRPWDVHAERLLGCVTCHGSINNPALYSEAAETRPAHLRADVRGLGIGEFLRTPSHDFAKGDVSQAQAGGDVAGTMRSCEDCHQVEEIHDWLPYTRRHLESMQCEACHVPRVYAPARESTDWTLLTPEGTALVTYRGVDGDPSDPRSLVTGYRPILLPRAGADGRARLAPQNLTTVFYWFDEGQDARVALTTLRAALLDGQNYRPEILAVLDRDGDGELNGKELRLTEAPAIEVVKQALVAAGASRPVIRGEVRPYGVHHGVAPGNWAIQDCQACHSEQARFSAAVNVAPYIPGLPDGALPGLAEGSNVRLAGTFERTPEGGLLYRGDPREAGLSLLGFGSDQPVDTIGRWAVILTLCGVLVHGGTRVFLHFNQRAAARLAGDRSAESEEAPA